MGKLDTYITLRRAIRMSGVVSLNYIVSGPADDVGFRVYALDAIGLRHVGLSCCRGEIGCFNFAREGAGELGPNEGGYIPFSDITNPKTATAVVECRVRS